MLIQQVCFARLYFLHLGLVLEKRLAMELITRTMQDMQNRDTDVVSEVTTSDFSTAPTPTAPNLNKYRFSLQ